MKAVAYYRVSTAEQEQEGYSLPAQRERIRKFAISQGYTIVREFWDVMTASGVKRRKGFREMIEFLKKNPDVRVVIAAKVDRLFRNFKDYVTLYDIEGIKVVFSDERIPDGAAGQLLMDIRVAVARHFINNLREDVIHGMEKRAQQDLYVCKLPYGYRVQNGYAVVEPEKAELVRQMFELYATGRYSLETLSVEMKKRGMVDGWGRKFGVSRIYGMLKNPFYTGLIRWRGKIYQGIHEPIVPRELFERVQEVLRRHRNGTKTTVRDKFPYSGLVRCGYCGCAMTGELKVKPSGRVYKYYRCTGNKGKVHIRIREEELGRLFEEELGKIKIPASWVDLIIDSIRETYAEEIEEIQRQRRQLEEEKARIQGWLERAYIDMLEGRISEGFWQRQREKWEGRLAEINELLSRSVPSDVEELCRDAGKILYLAAHIQELYREQPGSERRKLLERVCSDSRLYHGKLEIIWREPFDEIMKAVNYSIWRPQRDLNPCRGLERPVS